MPDDIVFESLCPQANTRDPDSWEYSNPYDEMAPSDYTYDDDA
jgi:hypothetical protein